MKLRDKISSISKAFLRLDFNEMLKPEKLRSNVPFSLFLVLLAMIYISNTHTVESTFKLIDKMKADLKEVRWNYMSAKSDLMYRCKQSEVAKAVEPLGLNEITSPPKKILIEE